MPAWRPRTSATPTPDNPSQDAHQPRQGDHHPGGRRRQTEDVLGEQSGVGDGGADGEPEQEAVDGEEAHLTGQAVAGAPGWSTEGGRRIGGDEGGCQHRAQQRDGGCRQQRPTPPEGQRRRREGETGEEGAELDPRLLDADDDAPTTGGSAAR